MPKQSWSRPSLEIHIPISPTVRYENMVHYNVNSLRVYGGAYRDAKVILTIGDENFDESWSNKPWIRDLGIEVRWVPQERYKEWIYYATAVERFCYRFEADMVLMLDADIVIRRPLDELIDGCYEAREFRGLIPHVSPFRGEGSWQELYDAAGLGKVEAIHEHTGWGYMLTDEALRYCPAYFNLGVLCAPADVMASVGSVIYEMMGVCEGVFKTAYKCQIAAGLAVTKQKVPYSPLPMRFNYPNQPLIEALHQGELEHAAIVHYLASHQGIYKETFDSAESIEAVLKRTDLRNANEQLRQVLRTIHPLVVSQGGPHSPKVAG